MNERVARVRYPLAARGIPRPTIGQGLKGRVRPQRVLDVSGECLALSATNAWIRW